MADAKKTAATKKSAKEATKVKTIADMQKELAAKQQDLMTQKRSHRSGELVNPRVLGTTRKEIARLHTQIRMSEIKESK